MNPDCGALGAFEQIHKNFQRCLETKPLSRPGVELEGNGIQVVLATHGQPWSRISIGAARSM